MFGLLVARLLFSALVSLSARASSPRAGGGDTDAGAQSAKEVAAPDLCLPRLSSCFCCLLLEFSRPLARELEGLSLDVQERLPERTDAGIEIAPTG